MPKRSLSASRTTDNCSNESKNNNNTDNSVIIFRHEITPSLIDYEVIWDILNVKKPLRKEKMYHIEEDNLHFNLCAANFDYDDNHSVLQLEINFGDADEQKIKEFYIWNGYINKSNSFSRDYFKNVISNKIIQCLDSNIERRSNLQIGCDILVMLKTLNNPDENHEFLRNQLADYKKLYENGKFADAVLKIGNEEVLVHKSILSARSPYFNCIFAQDENINELVLQENNNAAIKKILNFIYSGEVLEATIEEMIYILKISKEWKIEGLRNRVESFLSQQLTVDNVTKILVTANSCECQELKAKAIDFIVQNIKNISKKEVSEIKKADANLTAEILERMTET